MQFDKSLNNSWLPVTTLTRGTTAPGRLPREAGGALLRHDGGFDRRGEPAPTVRKKLVAFGPSAHAAHRAPSARPRIDRLDRARTEGPISVDQSRTFAFAEAATLTRVVRMLCDDLRGDSSALDHTLVHDRFAAALAAALLIGLPHNHIRAIEAAEKPIAPAAVGRRPALHRGERGECGRTDRCGPRHRRQRAGVTTGVSSLPRDEANGATARAAARTGSVAPWRKPDQTAVRSPQSPPRTASARSANSRSIIRPVLANRRRKRCAGAPADVELLGNCEVHGRDLLCPLDINSSRAQKAAIPRQRANGSDFQPDWSPSAASKRSIRARGKLVRV